MLTAVERVVTRWMGRRSPWTNAYGLARSLLALGTALTLVFNDSTVMFHPLAGMGTPPKCESLAAGTLFCRLPHSLELARWVAIAILLIVASGWRPRVTGVLHWWVAWSLAVSGSVVDGGDQIAAVIALVMIPMTITDPRRWHWDAPTVASTEAMPRARLVAFSSAIALRVQVAGIYFHAAVAKFAVPEWADGTAVYYSAIDPVIGQGPWIAPLFSIPVVVVAATWGTLAFETLLFTGLVMDTRWRRPLLVAGFAFHATIVVLHGLFSFFFTMASGLLLFLHPVDSPWPRIDRAWRRMRAVAGTRLTPALGRRIAVALFGLSTSGCYVGLPADEHPRCGRITELASRAVADGASPGLVLAVRSPQGHCDIAVGREGPNGADMTVAAPLRVGSMTKSVVAVVVQELSDEARLDLDAPIESFKLGVDIPPAITVRQLLDHTSGLPDYVDEPGYLDVSLTTPGRVWQPSELVEIAMTREIEDEPGARFKYTSAGYVVLGLLIESIEHRPLGDVLHDRILGPHGMAASVLATGIACPAVVSGWEIVDAEGRVGDVSGLLHPSGAWAAGALVSTASDLAAFYQDFAVGTDRAWASRAVDTGSELSPRYRAGFLSRETALGECWGHDGRVPGYAGWGMHCATADTTVVVLQNHNSPELEQIVGAVIGVLALDSDAA